jgi:pimeloyl-ACP methyl ester carboxylesterase
MSLGTIMLWVAGAVLAAYVLRKLALCFVRPADTGGDAAAGTAVMADGINFLGLPWGGRVMPAGLRRGGFGGRFLYFRWHAWWRGLLVLPALRDAKLLETQARRLAELVRRRRAERPDAPLHVIGYSNGGFVTVRALEMLAEDDERIVDSAAVLCSAFDPRRDLGPALSAVRGRLVVSSSAMDWAICGLGTTICGGGDGRHGPTIGLLGPRDARGRPDRRDRLIHLPWRPAMVRKGILGDHTWCLEPAIIADKLAPAMGIDGSTPTCAPSDGQ